MDEISVVNHMIKLSRVATECGILQLEDFDASPNLMTENEVYSYCLRCLRAVLNGGGSLSNVLEQLKIERSREELIIIMGFELIEKGENPTPKLGAMLQRPRFEHELSGFPPG
jgi:hypothetical protein